MSSILDKGIKQVINEYPAVGRLLDDAGIGCTACGVGTCLVKDIISIHDLDNAQEKQVFDAISAITGGSSEEIRIERIEPARKKSSPPVRMLVNEHKNILRLIDTAFLLAGYIKGGGIPDPADMTECIKYIKGYADRFHHAKEEEILFSYVRSDEQIIHAMLTEHELGRNFVKIAKDAIEENNYAEFAKAVSGYGMLLRAHIAKEDDILYPWIDRDLTTRQVGQIMAGFAEADEAAGGDIEGEVLKYIDEMKMKYEKEDKIL